MATFVMASHPSTPFAYARPDILNHSPTFSFKAVTSDFNTSIVSAMFEICLDICAMMAFRSFSSRSDTLEPPRPTAGVVGVADPDAAAACFAGGMVISSGWPLVSKRTESRSQ